MMTTRVLFMVGVLAMIGCGGGSGDGGAGGSGGGGGSSGSGGGGTAGGSGGSDASIGDGSGSDAMGTPPDLSGDGITWTWNGRSYLANQNGGGSYGETAVSYAADTQDTQHNFSLEQIPNQAGTYDCTNAMPSPVWIEKILGEVPPVQGFGKAAGLPCSVTVTAASGNAMPGSVIEGTFSAGLKFTGVPGVYPDEVRMNVLGRFRVTKQ